MRRYVVGVTGASGSRCARSLMQHLLRHPEVGEVHAVLSGYAVRTINAETGSRAADDREALAALLGDEARSPRLVQHAADAMESSISSGSFPTDGMLVVPCSGGTLAAIANGTSANLLQRAAEVTLKERRPLLLAFRETPLSLVHIENMRKATLAGAVVAPLMPAFYTAPTSLEDMIEQFTARLFDLLRLPHDLGRRWGA